MKITIETDEPCDGSLPVTRSEFRALESKMAKTIEELEALKADVAAAKVRSDEDAVNFKALIDALQLQVTDLESRLGDATPEVLALVADIRSGLTAIDPDPSNPPVEPTPEPTPTP